MPRLQPGPVRRDSPKLLLGPSPSGLHFTDLRHLQEPWSGNNEIISWGAAQARRRGS